MFSCGLKCRCCNGHCNQRGLHGHSLRWPPAWRRPQHSSAATLRCSQTPLAGSWCVNKRCFLTILRLQPCLRQDNVLLAWTIFLLQRYMFLMPVCLVTLTSLLLTVTRAHPKVGGRGPRQDMYHEMHIIERSLRRFAPALPPPVPPSEAPKTAAPPVNAAANLSVVMPHLQWAIPVVLQVRLTGSPSTTIAYNCAIQPQTLGDIVRLMDHGRR